MILPVVTYGDPVLRQKGANVPQVDESIKNLVEDMIETMRAFEGVGLAAQQIGKALMLAVIDVKGITERPSKMWIDDREVLADDFMPMVLINPKIISSTKKKEDGGEGCLSFPGVNFEVARSARISVEAVNLDGQTMKFDAAGLLGRAIQHEIDHLNGILFIDHAHPEDRRAYRAKLEILKDQAPFRRMPESSTPEQS